MVFLNSLIHNGDGKIPTPHSLGQVEIYRAIGVTYIDYSLHEDKLLWKHNMSGKFTISFAYAVQIEGTRLVPG